MIQNNRNIFVFLIACLTFAHCSELGSGPGLPPDNHEQVTIAQGVWGNVWFWEGNFMPGSSTGTITPVIREIFVYEATRYDSVVNAGPPFYRDILTKQVAKTESNKTGFFQIALKPGQYSFFVKEDSLYYANGSDSAGYILTARVFPNTVTKRQIDIDYRAAY
jgi:hypothetical protein